MHIYQHIGGDINDADIQDFTFKRYSAHHGCAMLPLPWFQCQPAVFARLALMIVQVQSELSVSVVWAGDVFEYRGRLRAAGINSFELSV